MNGKSYRAAFNSVANNQGAGHTQPTKMRATLPFRFVIILAIVFQGEIVAGVSGIRFDDFGNFVLSPS